MRQVLRERAVLPPGPPDHRRALDALRGHGPVHSSSVAAIELFGDPKVFEVVPRVDSHLRDLSAAIANEDFDNARWHEARLDMDRSMRECIDAFRSDLGLKEQPNRATWVERSPSLNERLDIEPPSS